MRRLFPALVVALLMSAPSAHAAGDPLRPKQWNLDMVRSDAAHSVTRGEGATIAIVDTGVDASHADLQGRLLPGYDFVDKDGTPQDGDDHGTHVLGIAGAASGNGVGVGSVAPGAMMLPVRVLGNDGSGTDENVAKGVDYAVAQKADVINLSLGGLPLDAIGAGGEFKAAIQRAVDAGVVVVVAAGNDSLPICEQPEVRGKVLCVGAVDRRGNRSFFSSGDEATIMAPGGSATPIAGEDILSTVRASKYAEIAGTSQAAPHVAGAAALLVSRGVRGPAAVDRILATARDAGMPGRDPVYGYGILDANAAVAGLGGGSGGGGGGGGGGGAGGPAPTAKVTLARSLKISTVLKRGLRARCRTAARGKCQVTISRGGLIARGAVRVSAAGKTTKFGVKLTSKGRRMLRRGRTFRATAVLSAPGVDSQTLKITFRR